MARKRVTVLLKDKDLQAVKAIQARFGLPSQNDAIRFALRVLALSPRSKGALQEPGLQGLQAAQESSGEQPTTLITSQGTVAQGLAESPNRHD